MKQRDKTGDGDAADPHRRNFPPRSTYSHPKKNPAGAGLPILELSWVSGSLNIRRLFALRALRDVELDFLPFFEGLEAIHLDRREVCEEVLTSVVGRDEAEPLGVIEPFDSTCCHKNDLSKKMTETSLGSKSGNGASTPP
jgi:hypothetical protein